MRRGGGGREERNESHLSYVLVFSTSRYGCHGQAQGARGGLHPRTHESGGRQKGGPKCTAHDIESGPEDGGSQTWTTRALKKRSPTSLIAVCERSRASRRTGKLSRERQLQPKEVGSPIAQGIFRRYVLLFSCQVIYGGLEGIVGGGVGVFGQRGGGGGGGR